jgi:hypothetical protein
LAYQNGDQQTVAADEIRQHEAITALRDWSKWLIGLDFAAATGCVVVLERGVAASAFLILAVAAFALSVATSVIVVRILAGMVEDLPVVDESGNVTTIYDHRVWGATSLATLVVFQMATFFGGLVFVLALMI